MPNFKPRERTRAAGSDAGASIRRLRTRGLDPLVVIAALVVLATAAGLALTFAHPGTGTAQAPRNVSFSTALRSCPPASGSVIRVGSIGTASGGLVHAGAVNDVATNGQPQVIAANGPAAAGLLVGVVGTSPLTSTRCTEPASDYWFTGLAAASTHDSVIQLNNPADTLAEVVITTYSSKNPIPVVDDRVLAPHKSLAIDLFKDNPHYGDLAIHASVVQGQASVAVLDHLQTPGQAAATEWLVPQANPTTTVTLLGLPQASRQTLTVANPGSDQITATVRLITKTSTFVPAKFAGVIVAGNGVATADLTKVLAGAKDVVGIEVDASSPITASFTSIVGKDIAFTGAAPLLTAEGGAVAPEGTKSLIIASPSVAGSVVVIARDASGKVVARKTVAVAVGGGVSVGLPNNAVLIQIQTNKIGLRAEVVVTGNGATVVPVARVIRVSSMPYVRPGVG